jgi:hypothetical protein
LKVSHHLNYLTEDTRSLLAELNGDTLWSLVVKQKQDEDRKSRPKERRPDERNRPEEPQRESTVWDVRRLIKFTHDQLAFLKSQHTPEVTDELRYRDGVHVAEGVQNDWDVLYHSQPDFDQNNFRNLADEGGVFQRSIENFQDQNLFEQLIFRDENSGVSQGSHSFRLLSSAYSFGSQTPNKEEMAVELKTNRAAKSFTAYILGQDESITLDEKKMQITRPEASTRRRKEDIFDDFLCDLFTHNTSNQLVQRVYGNV